MDLGEFRVDKLSYGRFIAAMKCWSQGYMFRCHTSLRQWAPPLYIILANILLNASRSTCFLQILLSFFVENLSPTMGPRIFNTICTIDNTTKKRLRTIKKVVCCFCGIPRSCYGVTRSAFMEYQAAFM